jgi:Ni/Co efflux regulator RcnB
VIYVSGPYIQRKTDGMAWDRERVREKERERKKERERESVRERERERKEDCSMPNSPTADLLLLLLVYSLSLSPRFRALQQLLL